MYVYGENINGSPIDFEPCKMCKRMIINAGIEEVIINTKDGMKKFKVEDWVKNEPSWSLDGY